MDRWNMDKIRIEHASLAQMTEILSVYDYARGFMKKNGNPNQWKAGYPSQELIASDIEKGSFYVGMDEQDAVHFVFAFPIGRDPNYDIIEQGAWLNENPYGTIHRIASDGTVKGAFGLCLNFCAAIISNIRIDTHRDNVIMQHLIEKNGFQKCGIVYMPDHSERIAYQRIAPL